MGTGKVLVCPSPEPSDVGGVITDLASREIGYCLIRTGVASGFSSTRMGVLWSANPIPSVSAQAEGNLVN